MSSTTGKRRIVVDDLDSGQIQYVWPGWFRDYGSHDNDGTWGPPYQHTLYGTKVNGNLTFKFNGTDINVLGTTALVKTSTERIFDPTWECFIDQISIGRTEPFTLTENNWDLCAQHEMADGQHELVINVSTAGQAFLFDSIRYTPSPGLRWNLWSRTSLSWIGMIPKEYLRNSTSGTYSIDGEASTSFALEGLDPGLAQPENQFNQIFFATPELPAGPHSLSIVYQGGEQYTPLTLDFLYVTNNPNPSNISEVTHNPSHPDTRKVPIGTIVGDDDNMPELIPYETNALGSEISPFPYAPTRPFVSTPNQNHGTLADGSSQWGTVTKRPHPTQPATVTLGPPIINHPVDNEYGALQSAFATE
ncbi:hypothetical protein BDZ94DRAFT_1312913 [Collybia nuda]|uniref:Uncharacterized protein n=1 Tax=Collybia nuda TaxID=64659 RepID=A0A9P5XYA4_9AGAR|nr:hypothetical protein BDZ94DRAFT_1312913 [Collybia nuda]